MLIIIFILLILSTSCINKNKDSLQYETSNEVGVWVSVNDTTYTSSYYLIEDSIYAGSIDLLNQSPREFFLDCIKNYPGFAPPLTDVDIKSFEVNINQDMAPYARDKNKVYYQTATLNGIEMFFDDDYGGGVIYSEDISINGADPKTFKYIGKGYAVDKSNMYYRGEKIKWNEHIIVALQQDKCPDILPIDYGMTKDK